MRALLLVVLGLGLSACAVPRAPFENPDDPSIRGARLSYQSVASDTKAYRPVGPKGWEELNRQVGPR